MNPIYSFNATGSTLDVYDNRVVIRPRGLLGSMKMEGERTIPMKSIQAVSFKKAGFVSGHIQLSLVGNHDGTNPVLKAANANTVVFNSSWFRNINKEAKQVADFINSKIV